ncbi:hemerythrin domain-containing protein [Cupriavidus consociatus]|uniref:hemerythrin domain-containing protein n=1 Tax=Cupriavidus consociatus TaxID=2821357 RepID=UPI001AE1CA8A|nr:MULTISPECIES: hemerythrin domain-containing protein [unclassified Cupriavidus]MBP0624476.1 hemerythrin domain-containing protein [Cupriavidus sp. LEh25]MDK2661188.1 hemerythrin domain-containing protein [Cupriavidus sp. LEh21]
MSRPCSDADTITCRHLLVPVEEADESMATVIGAIELARIAAARITFVYAPALAPMPHNYGNRSRELLGKAESVARAQGVPCASAGAVGNDVQAAIPATAREAGCDLVFVGAHGHGTMTRPLVLDVLAAGLPVFAMPNPASAAPAPAPAIRAIRDEHRALSTILRAWLDMLMAANDHGATADVPVMRGMIRFIETFPVARHHPRKQAVLYGRLRRRTARVDAELDELERQHERDAQWVGVLAEAVERFAKGGPLTELLDRVDHYAQFAWAFMGREEGVILPAAQRYLTDADWDKVNAAYCTRDTCTSKTEPGTRGGGHDERPFDMLLAWLADLPDVGCVAHICSHAADGSMQFTT